MSNENDPFKEFDTAEQNKLADNILEDYIAPYKQNDDINSLDSSMRKYDSNTISTQILRQKLLQKILPNVMNLNLDESAETDPDMYVAKSKLIAETRALLNDMDSVSNKHVSVKLKQKDSETQASMAFNAADLLNKIKLSAFEEKGTIVLNRDEIEKELQNKFDESGSVILDSELEDGKNMLPTNEDKKEE